MFDYQAGEKYKLTLIMVGMAGLMAGMFFSILLMPPAPPARASRAKPAWAEHPDVTGRARGQAGSAHAEAPPPGTPVAMTDPTMAQTLVEQWLPLAWDLSAGSAQTSQENAIKYMTVECAAQYRQNIWTPEMAQQINQSGLQSQFKPSSIHASTNQADGSVVVFVEGEQMLAVPGKPQSGRHVKLEYLVKTDSDGSMKIAGFSEGGNYGT